MYFKTVAVVYVALVSIQLVKGNPSEGLEQNTFAEEPHSLKLGSRRNGDRVLDHSEIRINRNVLRWVQYDYVFPRQQENSDKIIQISEIEVINAVSDNVGGYPSVVKGGPGSSNVTIHLLSRWNRGLDFNITVYGKWIRKQNFEANKKTINQ